MRKELKPTVWRTARALANADRLNLMRLVSAAGELKGVKALAEEAGLPIPTASIYLRALNARGLISARRVRSFVFYGTRSDRSLPFAMSLQNFFQTLFAAPELSADWMDDLLPVLKACGNPRREMIVNVLSRCQPASYVEFHKASDISETSFLRHLARLLAAGIVMRGDDGLYRLAQSAPPLVEAFLTAARSK